MCTRGCRRLLPRSDLPLVEVDLARAVLPRRMSGAQQSLARGLAGCIDETVVPHRLAASARRLGPLDSGRFGCLCRFSGGVAAQCEHVWRPV
jgi:hypothetical protein